MNTEVLRREMKMKGREVNHVPARLANLHVRK